MSFNPSMLLYNIYSSCFTIDFYFILGVVVDVGKLLNQLERSEQARFDAESRLSATNKILSNIRDAEGKQSALKEKLQVIFFI